jgi:hypothetical protein
MVKKIEKEFFAGVETNILNKAAVYKLTNISKSLTECIGDMYEKHIFSKVKDGHKDELHINELTVKPLNSSGIPQVDFNPRDGNWLRKTNVPILILNTAALNTGHNFQFTATWMGEPPAGIDGEIDANYRLRRLWYDDAPPAYKKFRLGRAVAASSSVPGLFTPIELEGLYEGNVVCLVDGGVHDNQGSDALLEQNCTVLIVSDASGQMNSDKSPSDNRMLSGLRANSILQARLRCAQYGELHARKQSSLLQELIFLHLKKDLEADPVDWIGCEEKTPPSQPKPLTSYGINKECQGYLANIRTDLDSFTNTEAHSLMTSGYHMTEKMLPDTLKNFTKEHILSYDWTFLKEGEKICKKDVDTNIIKELKEAANRKLIVLKIMEKLNSIF